MLTFFRRIRRGFLLSGSTGKYLLYALGEIALVVIGILIALQINNWNEGRKEKAYENKMLAEISASIALDIEELMGMSNLCQFLKEDAAEGLRVLSSDNVNIDSLADILGSNIQLEINFQYAAFESLKSRGLDYLSSDSIRIGLAKLYDQSYAEVRQNLDNYNLYLREYARPHLWETTKVVNRDGGLLNYPLHDGEIKDDHTISNHLELRWFMMDRYVPHMLQTVQQCKQLREIISKELKDKDS